MTILPSKYYIQLENGEIRKVLAFSEEEAVNKAEKLSGLKANRIIEFNKKLTKADRKEAADVFYKLFQ